MSRSTTKPISDSEVYNKTNEQKGWGLGKSTLFAAYSDAKKSIMKFPTDVATKAKMLFLSSATVDEKTLQELTVAGIQVTIDHKGHLSSIRFSDGTILASSHEQGSKVSNTAQKKHDEIFTNAQNSTNPTSWKTAFKEAKMRIGTLDVDASSKARMLYCSSATVDEKTLEELNSAGVQVKVDEQRRLIYIRFEDGTILDSAQDHGTKVKNSVESKYDVLFENVQNATRPDTSEDFKKYQILRSLLKLESGRKITYVKLCEEIVDKMKVSPNTMRVSQKEVETTLRTVKEHVLEATTLSQENKLKLVFFLQIHLKQEDLERFKNVATVKTTNFGRHGLLKVQDFVLKTGKARKKEVRSNVVSRSTIKTTSLLLPILLVITQFATLGEAFGGLQKNYDFKDF